MGIYYSLLAYYTVNTLGHPMIINVYTTYAIIFLRYLAQNMGSPLPTKTVAKETGLSRHLMATAAVRLRRAGLITSIRGPQGGYMRTMGRSINVNEVVKAVNDKTHDIHRVISRDKAERHKPMGEAAHLLHYTQSVIIAGLKDLVV